MNKFVDVIFLELVFTVEDEEIAPKAVMVSGLLPFRLMLGPTISEEVALLVAFRGLALEVRLVGLWTVIRATLVCLTPIRH
jgi:hypothetical protein